MLSHFVYLCKNRISARSVHINDLSYMEYKLLIRVIRLCQCSLNHAKCQKVISLLYIGSNRPISVRIVVIPQCACIHAGTIQILPVINLKIAHTG